MGEKRQHALSTLLGFVQTDTVWFVFIFNCFLYTKTYRNTVLEHRNSSLLDYTMPKLSPFFLFYSEGTKRTHMFNLCRMHQPVIDWFQKKYNCPVAIINDGHVLAPEVADPMFQKIRWYLMELGDWELSWFFCDFIVDLNTK